MNKLSVLICNDGIVLETFRKITTVYQHILKPVFDFTLALIGFLILSPLFIFITIFLWVSYKGTPFFTQTRPGKNEKLFNIIKFKTMNDKRDNHGNLLSDAERLTTLGRWVRKTSLDEIPQLINVLKGDMSLIGPRPLLPEYLPLYSTEQRKRHTVRPGITGWAQVNGRNAISWEDKFKLDVWYTENIGFWVDFKILVKTIKKVIIRDGISADNSATMEKFLGTKG